MSESETPGQDTPDHEFVAEWQEIKDRKDMSQFDRFEDFLDAADGATTMFEVCQESRIRRGAVSACLSWFGLAIADYGQSHGFPMADHDERVAILRRGELPADARAREWRGEQ